MTAITLQHFIYGLPIVADKPSENSDVLAISDALNADHAEAIIQQIPLSPLPVTGISTSQSIAYLRLSLDDASQNVFARAHFQRDNQTIPVKQVIFMDDTTLSQIGDIDALLTLMNSPIPDYNVTHAELEALTLPTSVTWTLDKNLTLLTTLYEGTFKEDKRLLMGILGAALNGSLLICNFPLDAQKRISLLRGLSFLLPTKARQHLTFTSHTDTLGDNLPHISFSKNPADTTATRLDWQNPVIVDSWLTHPYIEHLLSLWDGELRTMVEVIRRFDMIAASLWQSDMSLNQGLEAIIERHQLDLSALRGDDMTVDEMIAALQSAVPMAMPTRTAYMINLLESNFTSRDTDIAKFISKELDDKALNDSLDPFFATSLEAQPDAVYAFVRSKLNETEGEPDPKWLERLHEAAHLSIQIALDSEDSEMVRSWLNLIAREPLRYGLTDILQQSIVSAQTNVTDSPALASELLVLAVKRQPSIIDNLLSDETLVQALAETTQKALIALETDAIESIASEGRELFLLAVHRMADAEKSPITITMIRTLWRQSQQQTNTLPVQFRPLSLIQRVIQKPDDLQDGALSALLSMILADRSQDELLFELFALIPQDETSPATLAQALQQSGRSIDNILTLLSQMMSQELLSAQDVVDVYMALLNGRNWDEKTLPMVEQLSRVMTQYPDTNATIGVLWRLTELANENKNEQMLKVSQRRLQDAISTMQAETQVIESVQRLRKEAQWSSTGSAALIRWWRKYARERGMGQLQKLDKLLDGKRTLEDLRAIVRTSIALHRIIGNRTLEAFAADVATTYNVLQALSDGFDTSDKLVDSTTIRNEIEARAEQLPVALRPVLSTNLKELAQLINTISDNRSKPTLIRNDDMIERQLASGEQEPQSALDVMRWLSGYLDGIQKDADDE